jgi:hypothetical protein
MWYPQQILRRCRKDKRNLSFNCSFGACIRVIPCGRYSVSVCPILLQEIPTYRAIPLTPKCDGWCEFPVADRPNAVRQFFAAAEADVRMIKAPWILMIETDYVWMGPLQNVPRAESDSKGWAFPYGYIIPTHPSATGSNHGIVSFTALGALYQCSTPSAIMIWRASPAEQNAPPHYHKLLHCSTYSVAGCELPGSQSAYPLSTSSERCTCC